MTLHLIDNPSGPVLEPVEILIGVTTAEDITCTLGPPLRTFYKEDVSRACEPSSRVVVLIKLCRRASLYTTALLRPQMALKSRQTHTSSTTSH